MIKKRLSDTQSDKNKYQLLCPILPKKLSISQQTNFLKKDKYSIK